MCCATKRLVEIACPGDCVYLKTAEQHPPAVVKRQHSQDLVVLMGTAGRLSEPQLQMFFMLQTLISRFVPSGLGRLLDQDVAEATGALAASYETASRGVIYERKATSTTAEALRRELETFCAEARAQGGSRFERDAAAVLRAIEQGAKHEAPGLGEANRAYLELVGRLLREGQPRAGGARPPEKGPESPTILLP